MRFGLTPLYLLPEDIAIAAERIGKVMFDQAWQRPEFQRRAKVT